MLLYAAGLVRLQRNLTLLPFCTVLRCLKISAICGMRKTQWQNADEDTATPCVASLACFLSLLALSAPAHLFLWRARHVLYRLAS